MERRWYAVATKPRQEDLVCRMYDLFGIEYFLPKIALPKRSVTSERSSRSQNIVVKPMFPGYLFVHASQNSSEWKRVNYCPGVKSVVTFGGIPASVPDEVVSELQTRSRGAGAIDLVRPFSEGDLVVIRSGPLKGLTALFKGYMSDSGRVRLLMEMLRRCVEVEVWSDQIEKIE